MEDGTTETTTEASTEAPAGMADGQLVGGWSFIWAAYILTWSFLLGYAIYVNVRREMVRPRSEDSA